MERRDFLKICGGTALVGACAGPVPPRGPAHLLYADTTSGLAAVETRSGRSLANSPSTVPAADWTRLFTLSGNSLMTVDAVTGRRISSTGVPSSKAVRVVSPNGVLAALGDPAPATPYGSPGRRTTRLVIADPSGRREAMTIELDGNYEPDAFSAEGGALFVLQYLPSTAPEAYRVRMLDLASREVGPVLSREKTPVAEEETMRGESRLAVLSPYRDRLYTLYTHQANHLHTRDLVAGRSTGVHAFVHVLSLTERWAYCLDLPEPFGHGPAEGHAIAVSPDSLYVFDGASGRLVRADVRELAIGKVGALPASPGPAFAAVSSDALHVAAGGSLFTVDLDSLDVLHTARTPGRPRGLAVGTDGSLYAGVDGGAVRLDPRDGRELARVPVPGLTLLRHVAAQPSL
ncbi:YncE family protein [Planotetraspora phitsanulokensis]|nr:hypothetical protein [Planotetraspora phitsanulokensis]